jgi:hypothetical protein
MYVREKLRHEAILTIYGITAGFGTLPSLVYPWMAGGSLRNYLKREYSHLSARRKRDIVSCFKVRAYVSSSPLTFNGQLLEVAHGIDYCQCLL